MTRRQDGQKPAHSLLDSAFHGFSHLESGDGHPLPHDPEATFEHLVQLLCAGIQRLSPKSAMGTEGAA